MDSGIAWAAVAGLVGVGGLLVTIIKFWLDFSDRIEKVRAEAGYETDKLRSEREKAGSDIASQIAALHGQFALYREQQAKETREYITRDTIREFEQRIERQAKDNTDRIFAALGELGLRLDRLTEGRATTRSKR